MTPNNEDILADANDALRAELAAQRTKARRARHILLTIAYGAVIIGAAVGACVEVLARGGSFLTMVAAVRIEVVGVVPCEGEATDDPTIDAYPSLAAEEDDEPEATGVRVAAEEEPAEDDAHHSGEHAAAKGGAK